MSARDEQTAGHSKNLDGASGAETSGARPHKANRIRLACLRCQKRKIKCDGGIPKCRACHRSGAECVDGRKIQQEGGISRSDAAALYQYVQNLEAAIRSRAPDVNLASLKDSGEIDLTSLHNENTSIDGDEPQDVQQLDVRGELSDVMNTTNNSNTDPWPEVPASSSTANHQVRQEEVTHDIGLVPLSAGIRKYIGPSSGFSLTNLIIKRWARTDDNSQTSFFSSTPILVESPSTTASRSVLTVQPGSLPNSRQQAVQLSRTYFEHVHIQYPVLHEPTFFDLLHTTYEDPSTMPKWAFCQVALVLAISASILAKRVPIPFSGEGLCALAMSDLDKVDVQSSLEGLQCLLLVYLFSLHSGFLGLDPWYLNYQFLATAVDFGLQRDIALSNTVTAFEKEMRTRIFWVIYSIDRTLATTLGRPIGIRDEGCDLRYIKGIEDYDLHNPALRDILREHVPATIREGPMLCAKALFRLAHFNSEIKYLLHSVHKDTPAYTYPQIPDISDWQRDMWRRLQEHYAEIPRYKDDRRYLTVVCSIRYHEVVMHLFRPTPHIRNPTKDSLIECHNSAQRTIELWRELYEADRMSYSWVTIHSVCLSALTTLYCVWTSHDIAVSTQIDVFTTTMRDASMLLSAAGEYWTEARKSRNRLDSLTSATVRWLVDKLRNDNGTRRQGHIRGNAKERDRRPSRTTALPQDQHNMSDARFEAPDSYAELDASVDIGLNPQVSSQNDMFNDFDEYISNQDLASFLGAPGFFGTDNNVLVDGLFSDYQPMFQFGNADTGMSWPM